MSDFLSQSSPPSESVEVQQQVVINTRPIERAAPLTQHLQASGYSVIDMPMLALQPQAVTQEDLRLMRRWFAGEYQALVIVSPTAAASGLAVWQALANERHNDTDIVEAPSDIIAVGDATAAVLNEAKQAVAAYQVLQPEVANNEGMLAMPEIKRLQAGDKLLIWRGLGGRRLLVDTLAARGVHIDSIAWYERVMPNEAKAQYEQWLHDFEQQCKKNYECSYPKPIVVISSGTAFEHWMSIVQQNRLNASESQVGLDYVPMPEQVRELTDFAYVVLGERLAGMVAELQLSYWRVEDLAPETISAAINLKAK